MPGAPRCVPGRLSGGGEDGGMSSSSSDLPLRLRVVRRLPAAVVAEPFEILLLFVSLLIGTVTLLVSPENSVKRAMPAPALIAWGAAMCAASVAGFVGWVVISRALTVARRNYGRQLERLAMVIFMWTSLIWAVSLMMVGWRAAPSAAMTLAFGASCGLRAYVIRALIQMHELSRLEAVRLLQRGEM